MSQAREVAVMSPARGLTAAEVAALLWAAPPRAAAAYLLAVSAGLSFGELAALEAGDVDLDKGVLNVRAVVLEAPWPQPPYVGQEIVHYLEQGPVARRTVGLSGPVLEVLAEVVLTRQAWDVLWPSTTGGRQWYGEAARWLDGAYRCAEIGGARGFDTLRATVAARLHSDQGWPEAVFAWPAGLCVVCGGRESWPGAGCWSHGDQLPLFPIEAARGRAGVL